MALPGSGTTVSMGTEVTCKSEDQRLRFHNLHGRIVLSLYERTDRGANPLFRALICATTCCNLRRVAGTHEWLAASNGMDLLNRQTNHHFITPWCREDLQTSA